MQQTRPLIVLPTLRLALLRGGIAALVLAVPAAVASAALTVSGELIMMLVLIGLGAALASMTESAALRRPKSEKLHLWAALFGWTLCSGWVWLAFLQTAFASSLWRTGQLQPAEGLPNLLDLLRGLSLAEVTGVMVLGLCIGLPFGATIRGRLEERRGTRAEAARLTHRFLVYGSLAMVFPLLFLSELDPSMTGLSLLTLISTYALGILAVVLLQTVFEQAARYERSLRKSKD